jgi:Heavy metal associated domain 2
MSTVEVQMHHVPGRIRVCVHAVKSCPVYARSLEKFLASVRGVKHAECRMLTGSVIVHYDPATVEMDALLKSLRVEVLAGKQPVLRNRANRIVAKAAEGVFWFALEKAAERALPLLLAAVL